MEIVREAGLLGLGARGVAYLYRQAIRPWMPRAGQVHYAGIPVGYDRRWGDLSVPLFWRPEYVDDAPEYEATLVRGLRQHVRRGDRVVVIGGGVGVTATIAALQAGPSGRVYCFEGASEGVEKVRRTAARNGVADRLMVQHAIVARSIAVYGTEPHDAHVAPGNLPDCDVLELDCEGAEVDILRDMSIRPRVILVETHGLYGASTSLVCSLLEGNGYDAIVGDVADPLVRPYCEANDIRIVTGVRAGAASHDASS